MLPALAHTLAQPDHELAQEVCVVAVDPEVDLGKLVLALTRELTERDGQLVRCLEDASANLANLSGQRLLETELCEVLAAAGMTVQLRETDGDVPAGSLVEPADPDRHWVASPMDLPPFAARLLVQAANSLLLRGLNEGAAPDRTLATLIGELLSGDTTLARQLRFRTQALGFVVDGCHLVLAVETWREDDSETDLDHLHVEESAKRVALRHLQRESLAWAWTNRDSSLLFVRSWPRPPTSDQLHAAQDACDGAFADVKNALGAATHVAAGRSATHSRVDGLKRAADEARSAARSPWARTHQNVAAFDEFGLERALLDWYLSEDGNLAAASRLAPIISLPRSRSDPLLRTLGAYLDHQGSVTDTAKALFLHRTPSAIASTGSKLCSART